MTGSNPELRAQLQRRQTLIERDSGSDPPAVVAIDVHEDPIQKNGIEVCNWAAMEAPQHSRLPEFAYTLKKN